MLTGLNAVLIGGDARQLEVIHRLAELDASVTLVGFDNLQNQYGGVSKAELSESLLCEADAILLPVVGMDDDGKIDSVFAAEPIQLEEKHFKSINAHAVMYTGMAKPKLKQLCQDYQVRLVELLERDDVAIYNSIPTAEGALMIAIQNTDFTIHGSRAMVLGFGRTGVTMARTLQGLGAKAMVGVRREDHFARALEMGFEPFYTHSVSEKAKEVDLLFNTIPSMIVTAQVIANLPHHAFIIDLASKPGGTDFRYAERRGIKAMLAPGLPGIVAPKTAGRIIASCVSRLIMEDFSKRGNEE
ncbi:dipicolinate synthase subunit A [Xylanibacillus composti]|uniref:Dipicolinate synthase subunit A n=1 Tax=Xylanibacillus composti TaxID=1572762 RepID=A0A8J4H465_9BACL|nr:dipicolinate synthase subunit DpsA [Xylanibacillus composti]GIQ68589.1 dipicolinate synthase subunit A [Xylanibacillus composti]